MIQTAITPNEIMIKEQQPQIISPPLITENIYEQKQSGYDLYDYDNPMNYDLYFQSLYQMYPHMNDYFKQNNNQNISNPPQYIICNNGLMDENRAMYDPNYIVQMFNQMMDTNKPQETHEELPELNEADYSKYIDNMYSQYKN